MQAAHGVIIMSNLDLTVLQCCKEFDLHVKEHCSESRKMFSLNPIETHYIMRGGNIIISLNEAAVCGWIIRKSELARKVKCLLESDGLNLHDYESCKKSLLETVSPKANLKIYEDFLA